MTKSLPSAAIRVSKSLVPGTRSRGEARSSPVSPRKAESPPAPAAAMANTRIRAAVGGRDDWRAVDAGDRTAPRSGDRGRGGGVDLEEEKPFPWLLWRAIGAIVLQRDKDAVGGGPNGGRRAGLQSAHMFTGKLAAEAAEIIAVEEVGVAVFADGEDQPPDAFGARNIDRKRRGSAEIEVAGVKVAPVRWRKKVALGDRAGKVGTEPQHRFAIAPFLDEYGVAGGDEQRLSIAGDPALRPDAGAAPPAREVHRLGRIALGDGEDNPMIDAAIAGEAAEGNEDLAAEQSERAALVLRRRVEPSAHRRRHVDWPAGLDRSVDKRQRIDFVPRLVVAHDRGVEIKGRARRIDDRRAGHTERPDIPTMERCGKQNGFAERSLPDLCAGLLVEGVDFVLLGRHDQQAGACSRLPPEERLGIDVTRKSRAERRVEMQAPRALISEARHDVMASAIERAFVGQD